MVWLWTGGALALVSRDIQSICSSFKARWALIVTWHNVTFLGSVTSTPPVRFYLLLCMLFRGSFSFLELLPPHIPIFAPTQCTWTIYRALKVVILTTYPIPFHPSHQSSILGAVIEATEGFWQRRIITNCSSSRLTADAAEMLGVYFSRKIDFIPSGTAVKTALCPHLRSRANL